MSSYLDYERSSNLRWGSFGLLIAAGGAVTTWMRPDWWGIAIFTTLVSASA